MADQYTPGLQFQNWAALPSLTQSLMSGSFGQTPLGFISAALLGSTYGKEKNAPQGAVIPEENKQAWGNVPSSQLGVPPVQPVGLNPSVQSGMGMKPSGTSIPSMQTSLMDINRLKDSLWE